MQTTILLATPVAISNPIANRFIAVTSVDIKKIIDTPETKNVTVSLKPGGDVKVKAFSDENYNNPAWTYDTLVAAVSAQLNS